MSKEKQIEEMAKIIEQRCNRDCIPSCDECIAQTLYNAGCRMQSGWISVEERLPEESDCYLVYISNHFGIGGVTFTHYAKRYGWGVSDVTHWMPLPDAPKGGEE